MPQARYFKTFKGFSFQILTNEHIFDMHFTTTMTYIAYVEYSQLKKKSISTANVEGIYSCLLKVSACRVQSCSVTETV